MRWTVFSAGLHGAAFAALAAAGLLGSQAPDRPAHVGIAPPEPRAELRPDDLPEPPPELPPRPVDDLPPPAPPDCPPVRSDWDVPEPVASVVVDAPFAVGLGPRERERAGRAAARGLPAADSGAQPAPVPAEPRPQAPPPPAGPTQGPSFAAAPVAPGYPAAARRNGWEGVVRLRLRVDAAGTVTSVEVVESSGRDLLDEAAADTARRWTLRPALRDGRAVEGTLDVPVRFRLED